VARGEVNALWASRAGKSMVSRTGLASIRGTQVVGGEIGFLGMDWLRLAPAQRRQHLGRDWR